MNEQDEQQLILRLKAGDIKALSPLVTAYQQRALRTAYLVTQDQALAEDACQTAFLRAFAAIGQFDISRCFLPWFLRIVVNVAVQIAKKQARTVPLLEEGDTEWEQGFRDFLADTVPNPETQVEMRELEDRVQNLLAQLLPEQRAVIVLRYYADLTENEMSKLLDVPQGTVKSRLFSARKQLRRLLAFNLR